MIGAFLLQDIFYICQLPIPVETLFIKGTTFSPEVNFNASEKIFSISGCSRPESPSKFYDPIFLWIDEQGEKVLNNSTIDFKIDYFNTPSAKMISILLEKLDKLYKKGVKMNVIWHYDEIEAKTEFEYEFARDLSIPIQYNPIT